MYKSILLAAVCAMSSLACEITCIENCDDHDTSSPHSAGGSGKAGTNHSGGSSATANQSGGSANCGDGSAGSGNGSQPQATPCSKESDCERGFNCDYESKECVAAGAETCSELESETDCDNRNDCVSIYAGTDCSCGPECTCKGGEPGCVCEKFAYFSCEPVEG